jgi:electron transport complex protein RnfE
MFNGIGMGISVMVILTCANIVISLLRKIIPSKVRIACYIVIIATFVTIVDLVLKAYVPALSESLGLFIPLIVVNCIILGRAEGFASKNGVLASAMDGIFQGFGNMVALTIMCIVREFLGAGTFGAGILNGGAGYRILSENVVALGMILPVGGFLTLGFLIAAMQYFLNKPKKKEVAKG